jgi:nitrite reductase/ring-hydroxylating ferredoxin subunit
MAEPIATLTELAVVGSKSFTHRGRPAIVVQTEQGIRAFYNICTHDGGCCTLVGRDLQCELHGARFNPVSGKALSMPAPLDSRLTPIPIRLQDDAVYAD